MPPFVPNTSGVKVILIDHQSFLFFKYPATHRQEVSQDKSEEMMLLLVNIHDILASPA